MLVQPNTNRYSSWSIILIAIFLIIIFFSFKLYKENRIKIDVPSFYTFLPAVIIHKDLSLKYLDQNPGFYKDKVWLIKTEEGKRLIKHPVGFSVAMLPFFIAGHGMAIITGEPQTGYSFVYQNAMSFGVFIYLITGLIFLRKTLLEFFPDKPVALTLIATVLGTNLLWYSTFEGLMTHAISFSFLCISNYIFFKWLKTENRKYLFIFSLLFGLCILVRPLAITITLYFLIVAIITKGGIKNFLNFLKSHVINLFIALLIIFTIASLQLLYWKYATGKWIYDPYVNESFLFGSPQIISFLFSFRKGLFIYTPILIFAIIGLFRLYKINRGIFFGTSILLIITIYILSSWWAWSYGISWGMRPMIDYYSLLSIPLAAGFQIFYDKGKLVSRFLFLIVVLFITLNLFQSWQYKKGLIHYDDMSREAYLKGFFETDKQGLEWFNSLKPYNWERRLKGLSQIEYSEEFIKKIPQNKAVYLRGFNGFYFSASNKSENILTCYFNQVTGDEQFYLYFLKGDTLAIKGNNGKYLSVKPETNNVVIADANQIGPNEKFFLKVLNKNDNKIELVTISGLYLSVQEKFPFIITATNNKGLRSTYRLFIIDDYNKY